MRFLVLKVISDLNRRYNITYHIRNVIDPLIERLTLHSGNKSTLTNNSKTTKKYNSITPKWNKVVDTPRLMLTPNTRYEKTSDTDMGTAPTPTIEEVKDRIGNFLSSFRKRRASSSFIERIATKLDLANASKDKIIKIYEAME